MKWIKLFEQYTQTDKVEGANLVFFLFKYNKVFINLGLKQYFFSDIPSQIISHIGELPNYIRSTYKWLDPKRYDFESFFHRVIFSATRDYVANYIDKADYDFVREKMEYFVRDMVVNEFHEEIKKYYKSERNEMD
jgi:hypothetical protein